MTPKPRSVTIPTPNSLWSRLCAAMAPISGVQIHLPLIALAVLGITTSVILFPGQREKALLDLNAGHTEAAVSRLEAMVTAGDNSSWTLAASRWCNCHEVSQFRVFA